MSLSIRGGHRTARSNRPGDVIAGTPPLAGRPAARIAVATRIKIGAGTSGPGSRARSKREELVRPPIVQAWNFSSNLRAVEQALGEQAPSHASVSDKGAYPAASQYRRDRCGLF